MVLELALDGHLVHKVAKYAFVVTEFAKRCKYSHSLRMQPYPAPPAGHGATAHQRSESRVERPHVGRLRGGRCPANSPGGCRARTHSRRRFLLPARQVGFPLRSRSFGGPRRHGKGQRARATHPIAPLASPRRGGGRRCRLLACTADGSRHCLVS